MLLKKKISSDEKELFHQKPSTKEILAREKYNKIKIFYKIVSSKKKTILNCLKLNFKPLIYKIAYKIKKYKNYDHISFGTQVETQFGIKENFPFNHIESSFKKQHKLIRFNHIESFFKKKKKLIYEFGSGGTTILFAELLHKQYLKYKILGKLKTFEQSKEWLDELKKIFPEHLKNYVDFQCVDIQYHQFKDYRLLKYKIDKYDTNIDLVYIDGPTQKLIDYTAPSTTYFPNGNIIEMMFKKNFKTAFTDQRFYDGAIIKDLCPKEYEAKFDLFNRSTILSNNYINEV